MTYIYAKPQRLHCKHCDQTYSLPQGGTIKLYKVQCIYIYMCVCMCMCVFINICIVHFKEIKCPLDEFEIVVFSGTRGKVIYYLICIVSHIPHPLCLTLSFT